MGKSSGNRRQQAEEAKADFSVEATVIRAAPVAHIDVVKTADFVASLPPEILPMLDKERPYAEVCGLPGAAFTQDGKLFNTQGHFVDPKNCTEIQDDPDKPQSEEYVGYNQVTLVESEPASGKAALSFSEAVIYGEIRE